MLDTRYVDNTLSFEVILVTIQYIHPFHHCLTDLPIKSNKQKDKIQTLWKFAWEFLIKIHKKEELMTPSQNLFRSSIWNGLHFKTLLVENDTLFPCW